LAQVERDLRAASEDIAHQQETIVACDLVFLGLLGRRRATLRREKRARSLFVIFAPRENVDDDNLPLVFVVTINPMKVGDITVGRRRNGVRMTAESPDLVD
jgi:hypothetical protein